MARVTRSSRAKRLGKAARTSLETLASLARRGRADAAAALHRTAALTVRDLTFLCRQKPALFSKIARTEFTWPVLFSPHSENVKANEQLTKKLALGADTGINLFSGR